MEDSERCECGAVAYGEARQKRSDSDHDSVGLRLGRIVGRKPFASTDAAWNARGSADKVVIADTLRTLMGAAAADPYVRQLEAAIEKLDRTP